MRRTSRNRRRALMIETSDQRRRSHVRRLRRKMPAIPFLKNIPVGKFSTWGIIACLGMALFVGVAVLSPLFRLKEFTVERTSPFVDSVFVETQLEVFRGKNLLFIRHSDIEASLLEVMPELRDIQITEDWPRALHVQVGAATPAYNVFNIETANFSVIADDGIVLAEQSIEGLPALKIRQREEPIKLREQIFTSEQLTQIRDAEGILDDLQLPLNAVEVLISANELHLISRDDMAIWIDLSYSATEQLEKLKVAEKKIHLYEDTFNHIDLRIPQQIFWEAQ